MVVDERSRHALYRRLEEVLGPEAANTLIEHLPPVGWADVATKADLASLEQRIELRLDRVDDRFDRVDDRFKAVDDRFSALDERLDYRFGALASDLRATFEHELRSQSITILFGLMGVVMTMSGLAFALARFT